MDRRFISFSIICFCCVFVLALEGCARKEGPQVQETKPQVSVSQTPEIKPPPNLGVFYESVEGPVDLGKSPTLTAANPSFLIYLEKVSEASKLRLRFGKASGGPFIVDAGTVTSSGSSEPKSPPKQDNYQNILVLAYGEDAGVFEPQVIAVGGRSDLYKATYSGTIKSGKYFAFYFVDESEGEKRWEQARFKFAGEFTVK